MNYSEAEYQKKCQEYWHAGVSIAFICVCLPQLITCFISLCLVISFSSRFFWKGYHANAKILVGLQLSFVSMFCLEYFLGLGKHFYNVLFFAHVPCAFVDFTEYCTAFYYSHFISLAGMSITQTFLSAERVISSRYAKTYESFGSSIGIFFAIIAVLTSTIVAWFSLHGFEPNEMRLTCLGSPYSGRSVLLYLMLICCDVISLSLFIYSYNKAKKRDEPAGQYILGRIYQRKETRTVIRMFAPVYLTHFLVYCSYSIATAILRMYVYTMNSDVLPVVAIVIMLVPYYTTVELAVLHFMLKRSENSQSRFKKRVTNYTKDNDTQTYFDVLAKQWN